MFVFTKQCFNLYVNCNTKSKIFVNTEKYFIKIFYNIITNSWSDTKNM